MRSSFSGFLAVITLIGLCTCELSDGIGGDRKKCENDHSFSATKPATCTTPSVPGTCTRCKAKNTEPVVPILGHLGIDPALICPDQPCTRTGCTYVLFGQGHQADWDSYTPGSGLMQCQRTGCTGYVGIGDEGPAGGKIFYAKAEGFQVTGYLGATGSFSEYTAYYLEAASVNQATNIKWLSITSDPSANDTAIGTGKVNTALIIAVHPIDASSYAAIAAFEYTQGVYDDWFLPSKDELNELYKQKSHFGITEGYFWSSSRYGIGIAWYQNFRNGDPLHDNKDGLYNVRAIRAF